MNVDIKDMDLTRVQYTLEKAMQPANYRIGKTYAAAQLVNRHDAMYLSFNYKAAQMTAEEYSMKNYHSLYSWVCQGWDGPVVIDQDALVTLGLVLLQHIQRNA